MSKSQDTADSAWCIGSNFASNIVLLKNLRLELSNLDFSSGPSSHA